MKLTSPMTRCLAAMLLPILLTGCSKTNPDAATAGKAKSESSVITVSVLTVQPETVHRTVELVGTLEGKQEVTVASEVAARVAAVRADLGDTVPQGQAVVELDSTEFRLAVDRQQAALFQVLAQLGVRNENDPLPEASQTSIVRKAAADLADAESSFERIKALVAKAVESKAAYDSAEARYKAAQANYTASQDQVRNLLAQVNNLRAQLALAKKKLADCTIRAPFAGTVKERVVEVGQYVREQTAVMSIASTRTLKFFAGVPEIWFPHVKPGATMELSVEALTDKFPCRVTRVSRAVDPRSRTFDIEALIDNSHGKLRPGLFARGILATSKVESVIRVPAKAVISFYGVQKVFAVENGQIQERVVQLGDRTGDLIEVTQGLKAGERIATSELARIQQGSRVEAGEGI